MLYAEFTRMFTKGVIKQALNDVANRFDQTIKGNEELPVSRKLD
jgi:hypothetical protein